MAKKTTVLGKVLHRLRRYIPAVVLSLILATAYVLMSLYIPILVGRAIDCIVDMGQVDFDAISGELLAITICAGIGGLAQWLMTLINNRITYSVTRDIRNEAFRHLQKLPLGYLDSHPQGDTVSRVIADVDTFADGLLMGFTQLFTGVMTIVGTLVLMILINWKIALVVILITPLSLVVAAVIASRTHSLFTQQAKIRGLQTAMIDENVGQMKVLQAFNREDEALEAFDNVNEQLEKASLKAIFISSITNPSTRFINAMVYAGVALAGALVFIGGGSITVGQLTSFLNYANQYTKPFNEISGVVAELQNALACAGRVFDLIEAPTQSPEPENPLMPEVVRGSMEIRDMSFSYSPDKPLIESFDLSVKPGQRVAIVGPTGCGKTTFINLLMRFYDPQSGEIALDGVDTADMDRGQLRSSIGMVLQDTWLKAEP
ncbi:MAG: ABC transporter ATP-binding protein, partial [Ruminococcaceae bacterium]|nr:ABC transporter ATP-binding protein [Oscillospiraceae bacterium]